MPVIEPQITYWSIPAFAALAVCFLTLLNIQLRKGGKVAGTRALCMLLAATSLWSMAQIAATMATTIELHKLIGPIAYIGIASVPVAWFFFCITYSSASDRLSRPVLLGAPLIPLITMIMAFTNEHHHMLWASAELTDLDGHIGISYTYGIWWKVNAVYSYTLMLIGTSIIAFTLSQTSGNRGPLFAVIAAPSVVVALNFSYLSPLNPLPGLDLTTAGFAVATLILNNGVLKRGMLTTNKVVRQRVIEQLREGVMVVSNKGMVLDANPKALKILNLTEDITFNQPLNSMTNNMSLIELANSHRRSTEVSIGGRAYEVTVSKFEKDSETSDSILVFMDVSERRRAEQALRKATHNLEKAAHTDALTGLDNRRVFMQRLTEEAERVRRHGNALSVLLFDLDHFKKVNDTYGHDVGDRVLQKVAEVAEGIKRLTDVVARTGGEEFALLLPETDHEGAMKLAERLRDSIASARVKDNRGAPVQVTSSIGLCTVNEIDSLEDFLREADVALYRAKDNGRNQVCYSMSIAA